MKKFLAVLVLLIIIAGTVFYFGWVQIRLPEHTYGVIFTKTSGYHPQVVKPGTFVWKWERLIPTNFTMHQFPIEPRTVKVSQQGSLPSGEVYAKVLEESASFSYTLEFSLTYELLPEQLPSLVEKESLKPEGLDSWYQEKSQSILAEISAYMSRELEQLDSSSANQLQFGSLEQGLTEDLKEKFPQLQLHAIVPAKIQFPDFRLYFAARDLYFELLETRKVTERETLSESRRWMVSEEAKLEVLEKYGKLFTEYPGLIRYLALKDQQSIETMVPQIELLEKVFGQGTGAGQLEAPGQGSDTGGSGQ